MNLRQLLSSVIERDSRALTAAFVLLLLAVLTPALSLPRPTYNYIVVFDISQSMGVVDYEIGHLPVSRLEFAREAVKHALSELPCGSRVGWGAFTEYRTLLLLAPVEVCANFNDLLASVDKIDGHMRWGNRSEISKGIYWALQSAQDAGGRPKVLFLTDGQEAPPLDSDIPTMLDDIKRGAIGGWLIGVGGYAPRPIPRVDDEGRSLGFWRENQVIQHAGDTLSGRVHEHLSELREAHLRSMAQHIGFEYMRLSEPASVAQAMTDARFAERRPVATNVFWIPALLALLILCIRFLPAWRSTRARSAS